MPWFNRMLHWLEMWSVMVAYLRYNSVLVHYLSTKFYNTGKFEISLTVLWPTGKAKSIPDVSRLSGEIFPDGRLKTDAVYLSWQFLPSVNSQWRFSVRETRLSVTFFRWRLIPDGNRHRWPFLTVFGTFPDGRDRQEKTELGSALPLSFLHQQHTRTNLF